MVIVPGQMKSTSLGGRAPVQGIPTLRVYWHCSFHAACEYIMQAHHAPCEHITAFNSILKPSDPKPMPEMPNAAADVLERPRIAMCLSQMGLYPGRRLVLQQRWG